MNDLSATFLEQIDIREAEEQWDEAIALWKRWLAAYPNNSYHVYANRAHKRYINALIQNGSLDAAFAAYKLIRQDDKTLTVADDDLLCCVALRNEALRLPYFLDYYRQKGVTQFLIVDNNSTDESGDYLLAQPDVYVWHSTHAFSQANFGAAWFELLLQRYGIGHWTLLVDADELLYYPDCEQQSIQRWCTALEQQGVKAYKAILLDMYADTPVHETYYQTGQDFRTVCPYFDRQFYHFKTPRGEQHQNQASYWGGVRKRIFGGTQWNYCLDKVPLIRYEADCLLSGGQHSISYPVEQVSAGRGCVLHFKFFASFQDYVESEVDRQEHASQAAEYRNYATKLNNEEPLAFYDPNHSLRLCDSHQLFELGIMQHQEDDDEQEPNVQQQLNKKQVAIYIKQAESWLIKGHPQRALAYYEKIIQLDPHYLPAYLRLAYLLQENERGDEAHSIITQLLAMDPDCASAQELFAGFQT